MVLLGQFRLRVQVGRSGDPNICAEALRARYIPCGEDITPASATGPIQVDLPTAVSIQSFTAEPAVITCDGNAAALAPISVPRSTTLAAHLLFSDGSIRSVLDDRAVLLLAASSAPECALDHNAVKSSASVSGSAGGTCSESQCAVEVTYPTLNATLAASVSVSLVAVEGLTLYSQRYNETAACLPDTLADAAPAPPVLNPIACSLSDYEQVTVCTMAQLSAAPGEAQGRAVDVTAGAELSAEAAAISLLPNLAMPDILNRVRPTATAAASITALFGNVTSNPLSVTAGGTAQYVQSVHLAWDPAVGADMHCGLQCSMTFGDLSGASRSLAMSLTLTDGFAYDPATLLGSAAAANDILTIPAVFTFTSSQATAISVTAAGDAQLNGNAATAIDVTATTSCTSDSGQLSAQTALYANVQPGALDVDVGSSFGPPIQAAGDLSLAPAAVQVRLRCWCCSTGLHVVAVT
jgi:hypothetical protein